MIERRFINTKFEVRASAEGKESRAIGGLAAMVNTPAVLFEDEWDGKREKYIEVILPGAFDDVMSDDVRALFNHNSEKVLGRTTAGTLEIRINAAGHLEYDVPEVPDTSYGNDLIVSVKRNDINQSSFAFVVKEQLRQREEDDNEVRFIRQIVKFRQLLDVSPVTYPAYEETVTEMRGNIVKEMEELRKIKKDDPNDDLAIKFEIEQKHKKLKILSH